MMRMVCMTCMMRLTSMMRLTRMECKKIGQQHVLSLLLAERHITGGGKEARGYDS
jgi:hypothetical protein